MPRSSDSVAAAPDAARSIGPSDSISDHVAALASAWERGERLTAAEILERYPDLDDEAAIRLIYEETCLHREAGIELDTADVLRRYSRWADELAALFECDRLLGPADDTALVEPGATLGPFLLLDELGRGASGRTFLATEATLGDRPVVVKVIPDDQDEHLALARLRHTHIVPLFSEHAFPEQGLRGLCMPYLGGASLTQILKDLESVPFAERCGQRVVELIDRNTRPTPAPPPAVGPFRRSLENASYIESITWIAACLADALHYAHARGLVHMDLKPSNVLITVDGQPMLLDFHLAHAPIEAGQTITDRLGGTPGWMSPEQAAAMEAVARGEPVPGAVDGRSDIYALGLLLRESLGVRGDSNGCRTPVGVSVGLADIVRKCLAANPGDRYGDAGALSDDLRRQLGDLPLRGVRNRSARERFKKWRRRNPGAAGWGIAACALLLAAVAGIAVAVTSYRERADQLRTALDDGRRLNAAGSYADARRVLERGLVGAGNLASVAGLRADVTRELRRAERGLLASELHRFADQLRFRYGAELPAADEAKTLLDLCDVVWNRRERLVAPSGSTLGDTSERQVRADLLELAAARTDLRARSGTAREALDALDEAEAIFGPTLALDLRRASLPEVHGVPTDLQPRSAWEHYDHGRYLLRNGRLDEARREFGRALATSPDDFWSNFYHGLCSFRLRSFDEAVAAFRTCIALMPRASSCYFNRGLTYDALAKSSEAAADYSRAIELEPDLAAAWLNRGVICYNSGRIGDAIKDFDGGLRARPDRVLRGRLHYNLALAYLKRGDRSLAHIEAERAMHDGCTEAQELSRQVRPET
jgi:serine/threonine protein kinase/tetratricopeptide (TPR) repeat protein